MSNEAYILEFADSTLQERPTVPGTTSSLSLLLLHDRVLKWNGKDVPEELRSLPKGRYVVEAVDEYPALTPEEEEGLVEALRAIDRGEGESAKEVRRAISKALKR